MSLVLLRACLLVTSLGLQLGAASSWGTASLAMDQARLQYSAAVNAIHGGQWSEYDRLRPALENYPLAIYLDYYKLSRHPQRVPASAARQFLSHSEGSPLGNRFLAGYLNRAGRERRWEDYLAVMPKEPNSLDLKCYYFRAQLATGNKTTAWEGARRLWVHGESRPKTCDPLFEAWLKAGQLTDELVWARLLKTFDARERSLMAYVARKGSAALQPWSDKLQTVYRRPERLRTIDLPASSPYSADIASHGVAYLARYNPALALRTWQHYQGQLAFTEAQRQQTEYAIALRTLFAKTEQNLPWLHQALARQQDDKLVEIRLRWALEEQDWAALGATLPLLSAAGRDETGWRYWQAVVYSHEGKQELANQGFAEVARERDYYGFLAADRLGQEYTYNNIPLVLEEARSEPLRRLPAVQRIEELYFHKEELLAQSEWYQVLQTADPEQQQALAWLASRQGWSRMAIDAANRAKAWDALDLRFPMPYLETFAHYGALQKVASTELMAIARRESAFFPQARSPVGARGLMQIMPATGKQVAKSIGAAHNSSELYDVDHNVLLGSTYYRQLLDRFDGNRVFALTGYNAGPHRVDRWRNKPGETLPVEIWVETIPYKETRNYVQAVLAYNVVFKYLQGETGSVLTPLERRAAY